jgi:DNA-binding GntR family transcriptional regulator
MVTAFENHMLAEILRDLTARTILIAALYQSEHDAASSCDEHERITDCLADGDIEGAAKQMISHIGNVESGLTRRVDRDPLLDLRLALQQPFKKEG